MLSKVPRKLALFGALIATMSCTGTISDAPPDLTPDPSLEQCNATPLGPSATPLALLTADQYQSSVRSALADPTLALELDTVSGDTLTQIAAEKLQAAAELIVARPSFSALRGAICGARGAAACADDFIASFARRMFRRPATPDEITWLKARYATASADLDADEALSVVAEIILQSPQTVYLRVDGVAGEGAVRALDGYERAGRLAFFLWDSAPDDTLLDAAATGLATDEELRAQVDRMLQDPRARAPMVKRFSQWLELDGTPLHLSLEDTRANPAKFPADSPSLREAMRIETEALIERALFEHDGDIDWLLTTPDAYLNAELAAFYGVSHDGAADTFTWTQLPGDQRAGLFTRGAFLSLYANPNVQSPIKRGAFIVKRALCVALGDPPPNVDDRPVDPGSLGVMSTREAVKAKTSDATCGACHSLLNPFGYALGSYDALGTFATHETVTGNDGSSHDFSVDTAVTLFGGDSGIAVNGPVELSTYLSNNEELYQCFAKRWFGSAFARAPSRAEECSLRAMGGELAATRHLGDFIIALVRTDAFTHTLGAGQP